MACINIVHWSILNLHMKLVQEFPFLFCFCIVGQDLIQACNKHHASVLLNCMLFFFFFTSDVRLSISSGINLSGEKTEVIPLCHLILREYHGNFSHFQHNPNSTWNDGKCATETAPRIAHATIPFFHMRWELRSMCHEAFQRLPKNNLQECFYSSFQNCYIMYRYYHN